MDPSTLNVWAILVAAASTFLLGGIWYSPILFAKPWQAAAGLSDEQLRQGGQGKIMGLSFVLALIMAGNLAAFLAGPPDLAWGATAGFLAGAGWVAPALGTIYLFERRPLKLFLINAGYQVVAFVLMGAILGVWK
jgi:hypothetical protein